MTIAAPKVPRFGRDDDALVRRLADELSARARIVAETAPLANATMEVRRATPPLDLDAGGLRGELLEFLT